MMSPSASIHWIAASAPPAADLGDGHCAKLPCPTLHRIGVSGPQLQTSRRQQEIESICSSQALSLVTSDEHPGL